MSTNRRSLNLRDKIAVAAVTGAFAGAARALVTWLINHLATGH